MRADFSRSDGAWMEKTFKHSGDLGDIVFALPTIEALGGGILYLDPEGGREEPFVNATATRGRTRLDRKGIAAIRPLLLAQPRVREVLLWEGQNVDYNLDAFRGQSSHLNLQNAHLAAFKLSGGDTEKPWLRIVEPIVDTEHPIVISRSVRYTGNYTYWEVTMPRIAPRCVFVGHAKEHEIFEYTFDVKVAYRPTGDILELAQVIAGCERFIGNASLPHAIAEGLKKPLVAEVYRVAHRIHFPRGGATYI